jgi:hypothetical protein
MQAPIQAVAGGTGHPTRRWRWVGVVAAWSQPVTVFAQPAGPAGPGPGTNLVDQILQFTYTVAHAVGQAIVSAIQAVLPQATIPLDLVDPIGFLAVLTLFVLLAGVARRIAWIIVGVGWVLIAVRIALVILRR